MKNVQRLKCSARTRSSRAKNALLHILFYIEPVDIRSITEIDWKNEKFLDILFIYAYNIVN